MRPRLSKAEQTAISIVAALKPEKRRWYSGIVHYESAWRPTKIHPRSGAAGLFQIHKTVLDHFNSVSALKISQDALMSPISNLVVFDWYWKWLSKRPYTFGPTWNAWAYVSGPARVKALVNKYPVGGRSWDDYIKFIGDQEPDNLAMSDKKHGYVRLVRAHANRNSSPVLAGVYRWSEAIPALFDWRPRYQHKGTLEPVLADDDVTRLVMMSHLSRADFDQKGWRKRHQIKRKKAVGEDLHDAVRRGYRKVANTLDDASDYLWLATGAAAILAAWLATRRK